MLLQIKSLSKSFGNTKILQNVALELEQGEVLSLLGTSGSGKTTLLKIISGLENADKGAILIEGENSTAVPPQQRNLVYLYQDALLFPHLSVYDNIAFGLRIKKESAGQIEQKVNTMLTDLELLEHQQKMPSALSGGQRQRVAFGRAMIIAPKVVLLDEPFGALDVETRTKMQQLFKRLAVKNTLTAIFVTHDLKEAIIMGDRIGKIEKGQVKQYQTKQEFYADASSGVQEELQFWKSIE